MPKLRTEYLRIAMGVFAARRGDAIHVVTTSDGEPPVVARDGHGAATKLNWLTEEEVRPEEFARACAGLSPEMRGELVNVGTEEEPVLLTQQQAQQVSEMIDRLVRTRIAEQSRSAMPVA